MLGMRLLTTGPDLYQKYGEDLPAAVRKKVDATLRANPPRLEVLAGGVVTPSSMQIAASGVPIHFTTAPTGEVFVLLAISEKVGDDEDATTRYAVQRFTPGGDAGVVDLLTEIAGKAPYLYKGRLVARAAGDVYLSGAFAGEAETTAMIARFDGKQWTPIAAPPGLDVVWLAFGPSGEIWAVAGRSQTMAPDTTALWKRVGEGPWTEVALPAVRTPALAETRWRFHVGINDWDDLPGDPDEAAKPMKVEPSQVHVWGDDVWVLGGLPDVSTNDYMRQVVLRSKPVARVLELPDGEFLAAQVQIATAKPYDPKKDCDFGPAWVPVATLAPGAAAEAAAPIAAAFLASLSPEVQGTFTTLREVEAQGRRVIALTFRAVEGHMGEELVAAVQKFRPDEPHKIECWNPRPIRTYYEAEE